MLYFVKDCARQEWESKMDMLSMYVSGRLGGEYWRPGNIGRTVVHAADGECVVPLGCTPAVAIIHDPLDYIIAPRPLVRIGLGEIPGCTVNLASYPLRDCDMHRLPVSAEFDAVIGGKLGDQEGCLEALERAGRHGKRVAVAVDGDSGQIDGMLSGDNELFGVDSRGSLMTVSVLYRSCPTVVHLGDCRRGYLHSLAMYHATADGRRLIEKIPDLPPFVPAKADELIQFFRG